MKLDDMSVGQGSKPEYTNTRLKECKQRQKALDLWV